MIYYHTPFSAFVHSFKCYCWRLAPRRESDEIAHDNFCFCGFASVQLQSPDRSLGKADIEHITFKNDVCMYYYQILCISVLWIDVYN